MGTRLGLADGSNPHRWYDPDDVREVIGQMASDLQRLDPSDGAYFAARRRHFETVALAPYDAAIEAIKAKYRGTRVGASESIFAMLAPSLGLDLITPPSFLKAVSEGTDVSVADKETIDTQIRDHEIKLYVYNSQNVTPDVQAQLHEVKAEHIPYATITETLQPANTTLPGLADPTAARHRDRTGPWPWLRPWTPPGQAAGPTGSCRGPGRRPRTRRSAPWTRPVPNRGAPDPAIVFADAAVRLGGRSVWSDVSLEVGTGEFVAVLGPNGAGKSTLVKAVLGMLPLSEGRVTVLGRPPGQSGREIGYLPQRRSFDPNLRIRGHRRGAVGQ